MKENGNNRERVVFLDRDGVINRLLVEKGPRETPQTAVEFELLPRVQAALRRLKQAGFLLIVVTNQPNVAKGKSTWEDAKAIDVKLHNLLGAEADVDAVYTCWHHPDSQRAVVPELLAECSCRKPQPGLFLQAAKDYDFDFGDAWMIGDAATDMEAAVKAGILPEHLIFVGKQYRMIKSVANLWAAAEFILQYYH